MSPTGAVIVLIVAGIRGTYRLARRGVKAVAGGLDRR